MDLSVWGHEAKRQMGGIFETQICYTVYSYVTNSKVTPIARGELNTVWSVEFTPKISLIYSHA
jgi:hypothetical protein